MNDSDWVVLTVSSGRAILSCMELENAMGKNDELIEMNEDQRKEFLRSEALADEDERIPPLYRGSSLRTNRVAANLLPKSIFKRVLIRAWSSLARKWT